jgi:hypothetical protein
MGNYLPVRLSLFLLASTAMAGGPALAASCESLANLKLPDTTITLAQSMAAGTFTPPGVPAAKPIPVAFCRVAGSIKPTSDSDIKFELWLPQAGWTGRYESVGNGGFAGSIPFGAMVSPLSGGSAVSGTDDGHDVPPSASDEGKSSWALGNPEKIIDYSYRAVHLTAEGGKAITSAFYGSKPKYSYFVGCSAGGREALMEAQRYPNDFDGIVAGAPANQTVKSLSLRAANLKTIMASEAGYISPADVQKIGATITAACDGLDGVKDGVIADPRQCRLDPASLPLTSAQIKTFQALHDGPKTSAGRPMGPGMPFGSEAVGWVQNILGPSFADAPSKAASSIIAKGYLANFVYRDATWDFRSFDPDKSPADIEKALGLILDATDTSFAEFKAHNGKLISYHGWGDALITPLLTLDYYNAVIAAQGRAGATPVASGTPDNSAREKTQAFYRLFMAPGMGHCRGGPGPNQFGQVGGDGDADHDVVAALQRWVEKGVAPTKLIATKFLGDDPTKGVEMTRPLCVHPQVAKYNGTGNTQDAANFACREPSASQ